MVDVRKLIKKTHSLENREINLYKFSNDENKPKILFIGVFHGDEIEGEYIINKIEDKISNNIDLLNKYQVYTLPCLNPDGKHLKTRCNSSKIDLNRNYPTKNFGEKAVDNNGEIMFAGETAASELETKFMMEIIEEINPNIIISIHSPLYLVDYDGPAKKLAEFISKKNNYPLVENVGYETPGSFGTWAGIEKQIPLITLETKKIEKEEDLEIYWNENKTALLDILKTDINELI